MNGRPRKQQNKLQKALCRQTNEARCRLDASSIISHEDTTAAAAAAANAANAANVASAATAAAAAHLRMTIKKPKPLFHSDDTLKIKRKSPKKAQ